MRSVVLFLVGCGLDPFAPETMPTSGSDTGGVVDTGVGALSLGELTVSPSSVDFGEVDAGGEATATVTLSSQADRTLVITAATVEGDADAGFWVDSALTLPGGLGPGEETVLTLGFAPVAAGSYQGSLSISVSGQEESAIVPLTGVATSGSSSGDDTGTPTTGQGLVLSATSLDFGQVDTSSTSSLDVDLTNAGTTSLLVENIVSSDPVFSTTGDIHLPQVLDAGETRTLTVVFEPDAETTYTATLTITTDSTVTPEATVALAGEGVEPPCTVCDPTISVDTGGADAHAMEFFSTLGIPDTQGITIRNESDVDLVITDVYVNNDTGGGEFTLSGLGATTIAPWGATSGTITYTCMDLACLDVPLTFTDTNILHIQSNATIEPDYQINLTGL